MDACFKFLFVRITISLILCKLEVLNFSYKLKIVLSWHEGEKHKVLSLLFYLMYVTNFHLA